MDDPEAHNLPVYYMLRQVLQNQYTLHEFSYLSMLTACMSLVTATGVPLVWAGVACETLVEESIRLLRQAVQTSHPSTLLAPYAATLDPDDDPQDPDTSPTILDAEALCSVLVVLLDDAKAEYQLDQQSLWQIALGLLVDVLALYGAQEELDPEELDTFIAEPCATGLAEMLARTVAQHPPPPPLDAP